MGYFLISSGVLDVPSHFMEAKNIEEAVERCGGRILGATGFHGSVWKIGLQENLWPKQGKSFLLQIQEVFGERPVFHTDTGRQPYICIRELLPFPLDLRVPESVA